MKNYFFFVFILITSMCSLACEDECPPTIEACSLIPETGPCDAVFIIYYYDQTDGICKEFTWGGCDGVVPFETLEACQECECNENCYPVECEVQPPTDDPCDGIFQRWFYNTETNTCELIEYSGCGGDGFFTQAECETCICTPN